jgi:hypothetical protein
MGLFAVAQTRIIPHVSKSEGGFDPGVIISNLGETTGNFQVTPFQQSGTQFATISGSIGAGQTIYRNLIQFFGTNDISHFIIESDENVVFSITYTPNTGEGSPCHVHETRTQSTRWKIFPGDWDHVFDGFAVVNLGTGPANVTVELRQEDGSVRAHNQFALAGMAIGEKRLFILSDFPVYTDSHFIISSDQPISMTSLRGSYPGSQENFLWENQPIASGTVQAQGPQSGVNFQYINTGNTDFRTNGAVVVGQVTIEAPGPGYAIVQFSGKGSASPGDRLVVAASDTEDWEPNDGNVSGYDRFNFSHQRIYSIGDAGTYTYNAVAHNYVDTAGSGFGYIYGTLSVLYVPNRY